MKNSTDARISKKTAIMRYVYLALIVALTVVLLLFKFQNLERVTVSFLSATVTIPVSILVLFTYVLGIFTGGFVVALVRSLIRGATGRHPHGA